MTLFTANSNIPQNAPVCNRVYAWLFEAIFYISAHVTYVFNILPDYRLYFLSTCLLQLKYDQ